MPEEGEQIHVEQQSTAGKWILLFLAIAFVAASVYGYVTTQVHVQKLTADLSDSQARIGELQKRVQSSEAEEETIAQRLGMTKKELMERAAALQSQQKADELRLAKEEKESKEQIGQVSGEVAGVKTDVGGVKTDVASTKADLEATKAKLQSAVGDLGVQSWSDRAHSRRSRHPEAQRRPQLLRIHPAPAERSRSRSRRSVYSSKRLMPSTASSP